MRVAAGVRSSDRSAIATTSAIVNVRSAQATLAITGPTHLRLGTTANFTFPGTTEVERQVVAKVKRAGGRPCGSSSSVDEGENVIYGDNVQGNYTALEAPDNYEVDQRGTYLLCAWIQEGYGRPRARGGGELHLHGRHPAGLHDGPPARHARPPRGPLGQALRHPREAALRPPRALARPARRPPRLLTRQSSFA